MDHLIRPARSTDFERLKAIEIDAFETLRDAGGVTGVAASSSDEELQHYLDAGILLVAADAVDSAIGYVGAIFGDGWLHISEIDVARAWQRKGIGRALMLAVLDHGRALNLPGATLTTDRLAPFNAPFYASLGFSILKTAALSDRLGAILANEHAAGFDPARRVAMMLRF
jgi:GNAT superfamily N-acetyltransferase